MGINEMTQYLDKQDDLRRRRLEASSVGRHEPLWADTFYLVEELDHGGSMVDRIERPAHFFGLACDNEPVDDSPSPFDILAAKEEMAERWGNFDQLPSDYAEAA